MSRRFPPEGKVTYVWGRNGARDVVFDVAVPHGKKTRDVRVAVDPVMLKEIAACLDCCPQHVGESVPVASNDDGSLRYEWRPYVNVGHAIWHYQHPDAPRPCLPRGKVIDVLDETKLPAGKEAIDV